MPVNVAVSSCIYYDPQDQDDCSSDTGYYHKIHFLQDTLVDEDMPVFQAVLVTVLRLRRRRRRRSLRKKRMRYTF